MNHTTFETGNHPEENQQDEDQQKGSSLQVSPFYHSSVNEITKPGSYTACSHYLTRRWKRELGPTGYAILTSFRDRCFYNQKTGERREVIQVPVEEIADECGISEKTVRRELAANKALQKFVRAQREPVPDVRRGGWRWGASTYQVAMDDPLHPDDEEQLKEIVRRKAEEAEKAPEDALARARRLAVTSPSVTIPLTLGQSDRTQKSDIGQRPVNLTERKDKLTRRVDNLTAAPGQIDRTLNPDSSLPQMTLPDAAEAAQEVFASLSFSERKEPEKSSPWPFDLLPEEERAPWLEKAEAELRENFGLAVWLKTKEKGKAVIRAQRAGNLYLAESANRRK